MRHACTYEKVMFEIIKELKQNFYYTSICKVVERGDFMVKAEKEEEEMVGISCVSFVNGDKIDYEIRYNRLTNLTEGYTLLVPGVNNVG
jgi:hypothetical protein